MPAEPIDPNGILDRLRAGDPTLKMLRQSNIGSFDICARRAGYDMQPNQPRRSGEARCVGTAYHAGLEHFYRGRMLGIDTPRKGVIDAAMEAFHAEAALFTEWATSKDESMDRTIRMLDFYFNNGHQWPDEFDVVGVEQEFFLPFAGDWFLKGSIDLVMRSRLTGEWVLADHKTAGRKWDQKKHLPEKQTQAVLYCWAWWMHTGDVPDYFAFDVMTYKGEFDRRQCKVEPKHMKAVLDKAVAITKILDAFKGEETNLPGNPSSNLCSFAYCDYFDVCAFGAPLTRVPTPTPVDMVST